MSAALAAKQKCQDEAEATAFTIDLANRLVNGLASENIRWAETVQVYVGLLDLNGEFIRENASRERERDRRETASGADATVNSVALIIPVIESADVMLSVNHSLLRFFFSYCAINLLEFVQCFVFAVY